MFEDALRFPWNGEKKIETLLIGGVLLLLSVFLIPVFFVYGYLIRVIRQTDAGEVDEPPVFDEWGELLVEGVVGFGISLVYFLVPTAIVTIGAVLFFIPVGVAGSGAGEAGGGIIAAGGALIALLVVVLSALISIAAAYLVPAAVAAYARTGRFGAAFSPSRLRPLLTDRRYATGWAVAVAISLVAQILGGVVSATGIGVVLVPLLTFYASVAGAYAIGRGISDLDIDGSLEEGTTTSQPAV